MQKNDMKLFVSTVCQNNEKGFTFLHLLVAISVLTVSLPFLSYLLNAADYHNNYHEISVQQFFLYMRNDVIQSTGYHIRQTPPEIYLNLRDGRTARFEQYDDLIRRQVDGRGHEVYLRDIVEMELSHLDYGFQIKITTLEGETCEKAFVFYE